MDKTKTASKFNTFFLPCTVQIRTKPKEEKIRRKQKGVRGRGNGNLEELFTKEISIEELKKAVKNISTRNSQDMTKYSQNLLTALD
jgi:hypothetical protein